MGELLGRLGRFLFLGTGIHRIRHAHSSVVRFNFGQAIDDLLLARGFDSLGQAPARLREVRTLQDGERGP